MNIRKDLLLHHLRSAALPGQFLRGASRTNMEESPRFWLHAILFFFSSLLMGASSTLNFFIAARFMAGIGVGMASTLSPMYIAEISPASLRGRMVAINQLTIVIGILITNIINYTLRNNGADAWRLMFSLGAIPSAVFMLGILWLPESPRWLVKAGKQEKALRVLKKIGNDSYANHSIALIQKSLGGESGLNYRLVFQKVNAAALITGIGLAIFQQLCGINVVFSYISNIFESIGAEKDDQLFQTVIIGCVNLAFTLLAMALVDKIGRKPLMFTGAAGLSILYVIIALCLGKIAASSIPLLCAIALFATTLAPVTWILISEIFSNKIRSAATAVAVMSLWVGYFIMVFTFPVLEKWIGIANTFYVYAGICALGAVFILKRVRETKGKTLEEMEGVFAH